MESTGQGFLCRKKKLGRKLGWRRKKEKKNGEEEEEEETKA